MAQRLNKHCGQVRSRMQCTCYSIALSACAAAGLAAPVQGSRGTKSGDAPLHRCKWNPPSSSVPAPLTALRSCDASNLQTTNMTYGSKHVGLSRLLQRLCAGHNQGSMQCCRHRMRVVDFAFCAMLDAPHHRHHTPEVDTVPATVVGIISWYNVSYPALCAAL